jgi:hypothetical protein
VCIFTNVARVSDTEIYASLHGPEQALVYSMDVDLPKESAMVLPLPTVADAPRATFVDLSAYTDFFSHLRHCFPTRPASSAGALRSAPAPQAKLAVERVGAFEATFVPRPEDWSRIDERFHLGPDIAEALVDRYAHYSFAVFQLRAGAHRIHPMALRFTTAVADTVYFPTVHVHDNFVPSVAEFDHMLYFQGRPLSLAGVQVGAVAPRARMKLKPTDLTLGLVHPDDAVHRTALRGYLHNEDTWVALA